MYLSEVKTKTFFSYEACRLGLLEIFECLDRYVSSQQVICGIGGQINVQYNIYLILLRGDRIGYLLVRNEGQQTRIVRMRS